MRILWSLAFAQLRHHAGRWSLLAAGIALVAAVPVLTAGVSRSVSDQTVRRTIGRLDLADRTLLVSQELEAVHVGTPAGNDRVVRRELGGLSGGPVVRTMLYRQVDVDGQLFVFGGTDDLAGSVHLVSGRLPRTCTPTRCEVVVVAGPDSANLRHAVGGVGLVVVGRVTRTNPLLVSGQLDSRPAALVLTSGAAAAQANAALALHAGHVVWVAPVDAARVIDLGAPAYVRRAARADATLARAVGGTTFDRPDSQLIAADDRATTSARRFGLLGGFSAVLMLGFAVVAAAGLRSENRLLAGVLDRRGGSRAQLGGLVVLQAAAATLAGLVVGLLGGALAAIAVSSGTGLDAAGVAGHAVATGLTAAGLLALAGGGVVVFVLRWPEPNARAAWRMVDVIGIAGLAAIVLAADRGATSSGDLAAHGDPLIVALPVLTAVVAGLLAARAWGPAVRLVARLLPRRSVAGRVGLLGAVRRPLRPVATVAFLTAAVASVVFAGSYRATLIANDADQAAFRVPLTARLTASDRVLVPDVAPGAFGAGTHAYPVQRTSAAVTELAGVVTSVPLVAPDDAAIARIARWNRTTGSDLSAATVAARLHVHVPAGPRLPAGARTLRIAATGVDPDTVITLWVRALSGHSSAIALRRVPGGLAGTLPAGGALAVTALGVDEAPDYATHHAHAAGEGDNDIPLLAGRLRLGAVRVDGAASTWTWAGWGSMRSSTHASAAGLDFPYKINGAPVIAAPAFAATDSLAVPVAVDPQTAQDAHAGTLPLVLDTATTITARIVAVLPRLPTAAGRFVLADGAALTAATSLSSPGGNATEYWISGPAAPLARALAGSPLTVAQRAAVQADLDADPIGRGARRLLMGVALLALAVAALALVLLVVGERRDGAGELYAWEADGVRPGTLRRVLQVRVLAVAAVGVPIGVAAGLILARAATDLVAVDAGGTVPRPPLEVTLGSGWTPLALGIGIGAGLAVAGGVALAALRERFPVPAEADLR